MCALKTFSLRSLLSLLLFLVVLSSQGLSDNERERGFDLPLIPLSTERFVDALRDQRNASTGKFIPRRCWIAVRNASDALPAHYLGPQGFLARNALWEVRFCGNEEKDAFMHRWFHNSSVLWAYNILNPQIGTAKAEIWRLAVLYVHGGMYMDDDATIGVPLDEVVQPQDKFIAGKEGYNWTDSCFRDSFALSNASLTHRFGAKHLHTAFFDNRFFFNWALFSSPGNVLLSRVLQHVVTLIKHEYLSRSLIKLAPSDHRGKLLMCASTFPITLAARELLLEGRAREVGLRVGGEQFAEYGGNIKAWNNDHNPHRWVKQMQKQRLPYLRAYAPPSAEDFEGALIQPQRSREIFLVRDQRKHAFPDFETFVKMRFSLQDVRMVSPQIAESIPTAEPLPSLMK